MSKISGFAGNSVFQNCSFHFNWTLELCRII
jgi:hypothetical protein